MVKNPLTINCQPVDVPREDSMLSFHQRKKEIPTVASIGSEESVSVCREICFAAFQFFEQSDEIRIVFTKIAVKGILLAVSLVSSWDFSFSLKISS